MTLYADELFTVIFSEDAKIPGYLVIRPKRKIESFSELTSAEQAKFTELVSRCDKVLRQIIKPERIYTLAFCELDSHLHFHIFPRTKELGDLYKKAHNSDGINGPILFDWARREFASKPFGDYQALTDRIKAGF
ncbi:MAG: HIT family protein [Rickettsiales bacterium]